MAESVGERRRALEERMKKLAPARLHISTECNDLLNYATRYISKNPRAHYLIFVDCEGIEPKWENMSNLLSYSGDVIFVFQTMEIWEQIHRWRNYDCVTNFFGTEDWKGIEKEKLVELYKKQISEVSMSNGLKRNLVEHITVKGGTKGGSFYYDVIFAVKETTGGSPWYRNFIKYAKEKIAKYTGESIERALNILKGKETQLDWFINLEGREQKLTNFLD